jgi:hypothetical protein
MTDLSILRLNLLRLPYLVMAAGLGTVIWPEILDPAQSWTLARGVVTAMLGALGLLAALGLRYPRAMLPVLFFEMGWKTIWLLRVALPQWTAGTIDAPTLGTAYECLPVILFPLFIPWRYVWATYVARPADPWWRQTVTLRA